MYGNTKRNVVEMFVDRTAGVSTLKNRLQTRMNDAGNVELVAYGWIVVAEYNESHGIVTVFTGHKSLNSHTVNTYLNDVIRVAKDRGRDVITTGESPTINTPNKGTVYIGNYVDMSGDHSPVEQEAVDTALESIPVVA